MGFLSDMFDPIGAIATGGDNSLGASIFNPGQDLFGSDGLNWEPSSVNNFNTQMDNTGDNFVDNVWKVNKDELSNLGDHFAKNPGQLFYSGADPASTKLWNAATGTHNTPFLNQYGGETNQDYKNSASKGINTEDGQYVGTLANMIAGAYAGGYAGNAAGSAYGTTTGPATTATAGGEGAMGSSALDVQAELANPSLAGSGGSAAGYDAAAIPGYAGGAAGMQPAVSGAARGATTSTANALDNNQNPFKAAATGAASGGLATGLNTAGMLGIDDPQYKQVVNSTVNGAAGSALGGGKVDNGAVMGLLSGLGRAYGPSTMNWFNGSGGSSPGANGSLPTQDGVDLNQSYYGNQGTPNTPNNTGGANNFGNLVAGLGSLYLSQKAKNANQGQINGLKGLYGPNSPYAQQLQQSLERQDAAAGRRSQYGTRGVELAAKLAGLNSQNAPMLNTLQQQQRGIDMGQLGSLFQMGKNFGAFNPQSYHGLSSMYGGQQGGQVPGNGGYSMDGQQFNNPSAYQAQSPDADNGSYNLFGG